MASPVAENLLGYIIVNGKWQLHGKETIHCHFAAFIAHNIIVNCKLLEFALLSPIACV